MEILNSTHTTYELKRSSTHGLCFILNADFEGTIKGEEIYVQNCHSYVGGDYSLPNDSDFTIYEGDYYHKVVSDHQDYLAYLDEDENTLVTEEEFESMRNDFNDFCSICRDEVEKMKVEFLKNHGLKDEYELEDLLSKLSDEDNYHNETLEEKIEAAKKK